MIDETALAFEWPRRDTDTAEIPLDRISVRDHVREVEIGAFRSERGVTQRVRFNVVLEVRPNEAGATDDVDRVISYDGIVEAIDATLAEERLNLLETCAERVAARCLRDPRTARVLVRVEKLDRIPGALGVEIVRTRRRRRRGSPNWRPPSAARPRWWPRCPRRPPNAGRSCATRSRPGDGPWRRWWRRDASPRPPNA